MTSSQSINEMLEVRLGLYGSEASFLFLRELFRCLQGSLRPQGLAGTQNGRNGGF